jgi:hypothetical protein
MNTPLRIYDKKDLKRVYVNKFGIITLYKYDNNYSEEIKLDGSDSVVYLKKDLNSGEYINEIGINNKYFYSTWEKDGYSFEYRINLEKETIWKKKFKKIGTIIFSYSEYYEKRKLIETNIGFAIDSKIKNEWLKILRNEHEKI